ncbi:hypothetical protein BESB_071890 [Besnoitia besnoiti]|uniref:Transmembrane protein n=1 Tax=Besnoitia besnoiti TaxID=94643 RepID=A0A2A9MEH8_BESBE|nr:uncharacterized protein BESB_071890 [Besnoitia besnoiti]PFH34037.1 hypothetical protein BESB_071890 [Besnoitia besnoiti]
MHWVTLLFELDRPDYPTKESVEAEGAHWQPPKSSLGSVFLPVSFVLGILTFFSACLASCAVADRAKFEAPLGANWAFYFTAILSTGFTATSVVLSVHAWIAREHVRASFSCSSTGSSSAASQICTELADWRDATENKLLFLFLASSIAALVTGLLTLLLAGIIGMAVCFPPPEYPDFPAKGGRLTRDVLQMSPYTVKAVQEVGPHYSTSTIGPLTSDSDIFQSENGRRLAVPAALQGRGRHYKM